jgi:hypothetical protein
VTFSPESRLALDCCRTSFRGSQPESVIIPADADWPAFLRLVRFHRIEGLAWNALSPLDIPDDVRSILGDAASGIATQNLRASAESAELLRQFEAAGTPLLFLKGETLGTLAYGNSAVKSAIDIDLLVDPRDLQQAATLLRQRRFHLVAPEESPLDQRLHAWHRRWKESVWAKGSPPTQIDLHTRTADHVRLIPDIGVHSPRQSVVIGGGVHVPTLADDELFAYLAVHGASSAWFRLKWISDFAGLLNGRSGDEIDRLYRRSQRLGAGRAAGQALLLANELFGTLRSAPKLRTDLIQDRATCWLCRAALRLISGKPREPTERRFGTLAIHLSQFLLFPGLPYKLSELKRQVARSANRA